MQPLQNRGRKLIEPRYVVTPERYAAMQAQRRAEEAERRDTGYRDLWLALRQSEAGE